MLKPYQAVLLFTQPVELPAYIIQLRANDQFGNVRKTSKKHDLVHLYAANALHTLALDVNGKYS
ncbi:hypothetical protein EKN91_11415 [Enterobacter hormaechei]|nr:hypothetical protein EKN91_11415 [Enterobacter hormaechei]